jgi:hypothetical protein
VIIIKREEVGRLMVIIDLLLADAEESEEYDMFKRMVQKPRIRDAAVKELLLLLPQKDEAETVSQTQRVRPPPHSSTNLFANSLPLVNRDLKHYTPCFILED